MLLALLALPLGLALASESASDDPARSWEFATGTQVSVRGTGEGATFSIVTPGGLSVESRAVDPLLRLQFGTFDPRVEAGAFPAVGALAGNVATPGADLHIVQFATQVLPEYTAALRALGIEEQRFLPAQAWIVSADAEQLAAASALPFVRWVGAYRPEYRVEPGLLAQLLAGELANTRQDYVVQVARRGSVDKERVAAALVGLGGQVDERTPNGFLLRARLDVAALAGAAAHPAVIWIERAREPRTYVDKVRSDGGADVLESATGFTGEGVRGEVVDLGLYAHTDLGTPLIHNSTGPLGYHGTQVAGIAFGTGLGNAAARGILPGGQMIFATFTELVDRYTHTAELIEPPYEAVFQTNSWGNGPTEPSYPSDSFELDDLIHRYDVLTCQAMGNLGVNIADGFAWAKNAVSVGGVRHFDTLTTADDAWDGTGAIGPGQDGRIKPDLTYWVDQIFTTSLLEEYTDFAGTSAATPAVAGYFGLAFQLWAEERLGNVAVGETVFASRPTSATARALLFNTALPYAFDGEEHDLTRMHQGWGRPNVERLLELGTNALVVNGTNPLENLTARTYPIVVRPGQTKLRATLVYTDLPGTSSATQHRVNDLSLRLISPSGVVYWGNRGLEVGNVSLPGGSADRVNTTEQVWLEDPEVGVWNVRVSGDEIIADALPDTPEVDANYALVVAPIQNLTLDLGGGIGVLGDAPRMDVRGYFTESEPFRLDLEGAAPGAHVTFLVSTSLANLNLAGYGGPGVSAFPTKANALGQASVSSVLADDFQAAPTMFTRALVVDGSLLGGVALSNAFAIQTP